MRAFGENRKVWQAGTITEVKAHQRAPENEQETKQYDVSVMVGKEIALFTPKPGSQNLCIA